MTGKGLALGYFGKVGSARDFVRAHPAVATARALTTWMEEGRQELLVRSEDDPGSPRLETARHRFFLGVPGAAELLAGVIRPSADEGGLRAFPFSVFAVFSRRVAGRAPHLLPLALRELWDALDDAWDALTRAAGASAFSELAENYLLPEPEPADTFVLSYRSLLDEQVPFAGPFDGGFDGLARRNGGPGGPFRVPAAADLEQACFDASFWLDAMQRRRMVALPETTFFIGSDLGRAERAVHVCPKGLRPEDYPVVMLAAPRSGPADPPAGRPTFAQLRGGAP